VKVTGYLFNPPGEGEFLTKSITLPDSAMPKGIEDFALRSVRAIKHFWPKANTGSAKRAKGDSSAVVISGEHWRVEWAKDAYVADNDDFLRRLHNCEDGINNELLRRAAARQATKEVTL
jgi:hypothetical protein